MILCFERDRSEQREEVTFPSSPCSTLPLLTTLRIDVPSQAFLQHVVGSLLALERLSVVEKCYRQLHATSAGRSSRSLQRLDLLNTASYFFLISPSTASMTV